MPRTYGNGSVSQVSVRPIPPSLMTVLRKAASEAKQPKKRDIASRWTPALAEKGFTPVVDAFLDHYAKLGISNSEAMFLIHLMRHKWDEDMPFPGFNGIAGKMGVTDTSARTYARDLEDKGFLVRKSRPGKTTAFDLRPLFKAIEREVQRAVENPTLKRQHKSSVEVDNDLTDIDLTGIDLTDVGPSKVS